MKSPEKLATFLSSAARGQVPEIPQGLSKALKIILTARRGTLVEIQAADPKSIDDAMVEVARLALAMRSDDAEPLEIGIPLPAVNDGAT